jgi:hypothetical protein
MRRAASVWRSFHKTAEGVSPAGAAARACVVHRGHPSAPARADISPPDRPDFVKQSRTRLPVHPRTWHCLRRSQWRRAPVPHRGSGWLRGRARRWCGQAEPAIVIASHGKFHRRSCQRCKARRRVNSGITRYWRCELREGDRLGAGRQWRVGLCLRSTQRWGGFTLWRRSASKNDSP